jgi:chromate transporter
MLNELLTLVRLFVRLSTTAFGGPAAHIAMMEEEVVGQRQWLSRQSFLDLVGATNLIPGPNSTEMTMHVGHVRAGWAGLAAAGASFIIPASLITGYVIAGWPGALAATVGIFLPAFIFVAALTPLIPKLRRSAWMAAFLDAINVSAVGLMTVVCIQLGQAALVSWQTWLLFAAALILAIGWNINSALLVAGGALAGWLIIG